jgi:hypothetical protein
MKMRLRLAVLAAIALACVAQRAQAGCVISRDGKSIDVVTGNAASEEKNCAVKCQVDTKIGVIAVSCGGNTPPLATAHSLCNFDKPEPWYKKVVSSQDTCEGGSAAAAPAAPATVPAAAPAPAVKPGTFICRISADGHSFDAMIANPYAADASCQVNCRISTTVAGTTEQSSCTKNVAPGVGEVVLCTHTFDKGRLVKVVGGSGSCFDPTPKPRAADTPEIDADELANQPMPKPSSAKKDDADLEGIADDPDKLDAYIRKQLPPDARKIFDDMNKN